ncbi:hypothetical protein [Streptomyces flavovirens]|uniref:hypothetical protein n=1 Tax=Streptomyces flavovirens TaxID=52258 RepID=UPI0031ED190B
MRSGSPSPRAAPPPWGLTADTRLGGTVDGTYSATVVASQDGRTVRTPAAVEREGESYDVTFRAIGRDGATGTNCRPT